MRSSIAKTLRKVRVQEAQVVLITPVWKAQPWYASLLAMLVDRPCRLPQQRDDPYLDITPQLAVWNISGKTSVVETFQTRLQSLSWSHGGHRQTSLMTHLLMLIVYP